MDKWLTLLALLLLTTVILFVLDIFPYPFGILILTLLLIGRVLRLQHK